MVRTVLHRLSSAVTHSRFCASPEMTVRKMASANLTGGSPVHASSGTGPFTWTLCRCRGRLKTGSQVGSTQLPRGRTSTHAGVFSADGRHSRVLSASGTDNKPLQHLRNKNSLLEGVALADVFYSKMFSVFTLACQSCFPLLEGKCFIKKCFFGPQLQSCDPQATWHNPAEALTGFTTS